MTVYIDNVVEGMEISLPSCHTFINTRTSELLIINDNWEMDEDNNLQDFQKHKKDYAGLPCSHEIHEYRMMEQFITTVTDDEQANTLWMAINGSGAFRRFKDTILHYGIGDRWFAFRQQRYLTIAKYWCADNGLDYTFKHPESILSCRSLMNDHPVDALAQEGDIVLKNGIFQFNITQLLSDISSRPWDIDDFEVVKLKVDDWISDVEDEDKDANDATEDLLYSPLLLLEVSPDRRLITPDDPFALRFCGILVDGSRKLFAAKRAGQDTLDAYFIPMEVHEAYICKNRAEYTKYWNSKIEDAVHDIERMRKHA